MVVDADVDGPVAWLATAYVPGPSLSEGVDARGPLPAGALLTLAAGLAESLSAIHRAGVVHRDLKPSNVLLAEDGPRVIDFGISQAVESTQLTQAGLGLGSPGFMSPEQAAGYEVGPPSDIFSLGAVLTFAATGEGPFGTGITAALLYRVVHDSPSLDRVPSEVRPLIERCLAKDPSQRPTADGLLAEVGALQPTPDWLPESIIRAFSQDPAPATPASPATPAAALGSLAALGIASQAATQTMAAVAAAQVPSGESLPLTPAGNPPTVTSKSMPPPPDTYPPGDTYLQPSPDGRNRRAALAAADRAGAAHRRPHRGIRRRFRRDRVHQARTRRDSVPGGTGFPTDGINVSRTDDLWRVCLPVCLAARLLAQRAHHRPRSHSSCR